MKSQVMLVVLSILSVQLAHAEKAKDLPACANIVKSCEAAGYKPGDHKKTGKGLWVDCVGAIAKGQTVSGVTATQADAQACKDAHKSLKAEKKKK